MSDADGDDVAGAGLVNLSFAGAGAIAVAGGAGAASPDTFAWLTVGVAVVAFAAGVATFLWGYAIGVARSRDDAVTLGGLFWLTDTAPPLVRRRLRGAFAAQVAVAVAVASIRPYTSVAFVVLAPMLGLGMLALWGARHGRFGPRTR